MRTSLAIAALLTAGIACSGSAQAQNYPWCAQYGGRTGGGMNCGFVSFDQCMLTVRGMGGFCIANNRYVPPAGVASPKHKRSKHKTHSRS